MEKGLHNAPLNDIDELDEAENGALLKSVVTRLREKGANKSADLIAAGKGDEMPRYVQLLKKYRNLLDGRNITEIGKKASLDAFDELTAKNMAEELAKLELGAQEREGKKEAYRAAPRLPETGPRKAKTEQIILDIKGGNTELDALNSKIKKSKDEQREQAISEFYKKAEELINKHTALATQYPDDPRLKATIETSIQYINNSVQLIKEYFDKSEK
jgi:hypothetical protein